MKKFRILTVFFALLLSMMMVSTPAMAADFSSNLEPQATESVVKTPRGFSRNYDDVALTTSAKVLMDDENWWGENTVTVTVGKLSKNATVAFSCYTRKSENDDWEYWDTSSALSLSDPSDKFDIPSGVQFQIRVWASEKCNADLIVSLT